MSSTAKCSPYTVLMTSENATVNSGVFCDGDNAVNVGQLTQNHLTVDNLLRIKLMKFKVLVPVRSVAKKCWADAFVARPYQKLPHVEKLQCVYAHNVLATHMSVCASVFAIAHITHVIRRITHQTMPAILCMNASHEPCARLTQSL